MTFKDDIKSEWKKYAIGLVVVASFSFGGNILALFQTGADVELERKLKPIIEKVFDDKMSNEEEVQKFLKHTVITDFVHEVRVESQKQILKIHSKDSIKLRGLLRLEMDLRESQDVAQELGWTYLEVKGMKKYVDSVVIYKVKQAHRLAKF